MNETISRKHGHFYLEIIWTPMGFVWYLWQLWKKNKYLEVDQVIKNHHIEVYFVNLYRQKCPFCMFTIKILNDISSKISHISQFTNIFFSQKYYFVWTIYSHCYLWCSDPMDEFFYRNLFLGLSQGQLSRFLCNFPWLMFFSPWKFLNYYKENHLNN